MKAKEYAKKYIEDPTQENLDKITVKFWEEAAQVEKQRNIRTNPALFALFNELDQKWRAFCRALPEGHFLHPDIDDVPKLIESSRPELYKKWLKYRENTRPVFIEKWRS